jgi:pimeloyl-ACP methyl ester carboxylesterase
MSVEDHYRRQPQPWRPGPDGPLDPWADLGPLPPPPAEPGPWATASPGPFREDRLRLHVTLARTRRLGTAILVPPWKIPSRALLAGWRRLLERAGFDTWLLVPPYHLERTAAGARSGEGFVSADLGRFRAALAQTVLEVRLCAALSAPRGQVVVLGLSLGALVAAWAATGPERVDAAALVAAPADLAAVFQGTPIGARYARMAESAGTPLPSPPELEARLQPLVPLHRSPTARRIFVAGGSEDAIALRGPEALARAWGLRLQSYPRGHMTLLFACRALRRDVRDFLADGAI